MADKKKAEETKSEEKAPETKVAAAPKDNKMMLIGIAAAVLVLVVVAVVGVVVLGGSDEESESGEIPKDYEKFDGDNYSFGYPKDWVLEEASEGVTVQPKAQAEALETEDEEALLGNLNDTVSIQIQGVDEEVRDLILDGKCEEVANNVLGLDEMEGFDFGIEPTNIDSFKQGGEKACRFEASVTFLVEINTKVVAVANDDAAYAITLAGTGEKGDNYDEGLKVQNTFKLEN